MLTKNFLGQRQVTENIISFHPFSKILWFIIKFNTYRLSLSSPPHPPCRALLIARFKHLLTVFCFMFSWTKTSWGHVLWFSLSPKGPFRKQHLLYFYHYVPYIKCFTYFISFNHYNVVTDIILPILQKKQGYEEVGLKSQS